MMLGLWIYACVLALAVLVVGGALWLTRKPEDQPETDKNEDTKNE